MHALLRCSFFSRLAAVLYTRGQVDFQYTATFDGNAVLGDDDGFNKGGGGGLAVGAVSGSVMFHDFAYFMGNEVRNGGRGGGMENLGEAYFSRASYFMGNYAGGECSWNSEIPRCVGAPPTR